MHNIGKASLEQANVEVVRTSYELARLSYKTEKINDSDLAPYGLSLELDSFIEGEDLRFFVAGNSQEIYITFRGTQGEGDFEIDFLFKKVDFGQEGEVHEGFWESTQFLYPQVKDYIQNQQSNRKIIIVGHSLGGAIASLTAAQSVVDGFQIQTLCTIAAPRVGDSTFRSFFEKSFKGDIYAFVNSKDIVPLAPTRFLGFRHAYSLFFKVSPPNIDIAMDSFFDLSLIRELWYLVRNLFSRISVEGSIMEYHTLESAKGYLILKNFDGVTP